MECRTEASQHKIEWEDFSTISSTSVQVHTQKSTSWGTENLKMGEELNKKEKYGQEADT